MTNPLTNKGKNRVAQLIENQLATDANGLDRAFPARSRAALARAAATPRGGLAPLFPMPLFPTPYLISAKAGDWT